LAGVSAPAGPEGGLVISGLVVLLAALAYRSCKKRKLGEVGNSKLRITFELTAMLAIVLAIILQNDLKNRIVTDPVPMLVIPMIAMMSYLVISLRTLKPSG
jgi:hypothetical protein